MLYKKKFVLGFILVSFFTGINAQENNKRFSHPLVSGPTGYYFDDDTIVTQFGTFTKGNFGPFICVNKKPCADNLPGFKDGKFVAEGKLTKVHYRNDKQPAGALAIIRSYEQIFKQMGGSKLTSNDAPNTGTHLFHLKKDNSETWMILDTSDNITTLTFLDSKVFEQLVTAGQLADQINKQGFVNLNVNFDTNKSLIKDSDKLAINEVVALLKNDLNLKLSVEGHTDNVGNAAANKTLSQAQSDSLVAYMVAAGIPAKRLMAKGFGSESPISDNRTDEGKAKNRRVELVKIK